MTTAQVQVRIDDEIATVSLARPERLNSLTLDMLAQLSRTAHELRRDQSVRGVILRGEGRSFCAGLDFKSALKEPGRVARSFVPNPIRGTNLFQEACWAWRRIPVPVVAVVHGHCFGGGLQLALGADFRFTTPDAQWSVMEGRWGLVPDMSGVTALSQLVGLDTAKRLTFTAAVIDGTRAHALGLSSGVGGDPSALASELLAEVKPHSRTAIGAAKRLFDTTWARGPRATMIRERATQIPLLLGSEFRSRMANRAP